MAQIVRIPVQRLLSGDASVQADIAKASAQQFACVHATHAHDTGLCRSSYRFSCNAYAVLCCAARWRMAHGLFACACMHAQAYGPSGLGVLSVSGVQGYVAARRRLLSLAPQV